MFMQFEWHDSRPGKRLPVEHFEITNDSGMIKATSTATEDEDVNHDATFYSAVRHFLIEGPIKAITLTVEPDADEPKWG